MLYKEEISTHLIYLNHCFYKCFFMFVRSNNRKKKIQTNILKVIIRYQSHEDKSSDYHQWEHNFFPYYL